MSVEVLYFGCGRNGQAGHYLWGPDGHTQARLWLRRRDQALSRSAERLKNQIDGIYPPVEEREIEGRALRHHVHGWTIVAWWDRTVDKRGASNSAVLIHGEYAFDEAMTWARRLMLWVFERQAFEVINVALGDTMDARLTRLVDARVTERYAIKELVW